MLLLLIAAAVGGTGFQMARAMSLVRLGTQLDQRLQAAVWDRVLRLRLSFFRQYLTGDLTWRILGVDTMRRILTGQSVNARDRWRLLAGQPGDHADLRRRAHAVRRRLCLCGRRASVRDRSRPEAQAAAGFHPYGHRLGPSDRADRRHRQAARRRAPSCAPSRAGRPPLPISVAAPPGRCAPTPCRRSPPRACRSSAPSASSASPPVATTRSMSGHSPRSTPPSASSRLRS